MGLTGGDRFVRPRAFFWGAACAFAACCLAGRLGSRHNPFEHFERFHFNLSCTTLFYPTASQLRALGEARLEPARVAVIVGGNSILFGVGQSESEVWTRQLQDRLGDGYRVLNLGMRGGDPHEFGAVAAEVLAADRPRLILVTDLYPAAYAGEPDGDQYRYLFWDAYYKGLLRPDPGREEVLAGLTARRRGRTEFQETRARALLDSGCYFDDLWTSVAYSRAGTVWTPLLADSWYRPRRRQADPEPPALPPERRYPPEHEGPATEIVRGWLTHNGCRRGPGGRWVDDPASPVWAGLRASACACFPQPYRARTLMVVTTESPHYVGRLTPDERELYYALSRLTAEKLEGAGFAALDMGDGFTVEDFSDRCHLAAAGGAKLADKVADRVRRLAGDLGYVRPEGVGDAEGR
jgi:hypothetical protein